MRKEDLLAHKDGTYPLPLQIERIFKNSNYNDFEEWKNLMVFGDNLQLLKTIYEDKDPLIKNKVKGKIKLIYIDPPFATQGDFSNRDNAKAYSDKKQGSEFIEFLRRRLILAKEILADDGSIFVHVDQKMGHYVQMIMDEVFGKNNMHNEIIWHFKTYQGQVKNYYPRKHNNIYWYYNKVKPEFELQYDDAYEDTVDAERWRKYIVNGNKIMGGHYPKTDSRFKGYYDRFVKEHGRKPKATDVIMTVQGYVVDDVWTDIRALDPKDKTERIGYPTQKPEALLQRIIESATKPGDLVLDFFGGSGTTMAVAEKLKRRWITCDLGKLSYLTMQKRILKIGTSSDLINEGTYNRKPQTFATCNLGVYNLKQTLEMDWEKYQEFVSQLFELERKEININGISFDGIKRNALVKIFNYQEFEDVAIDEFYLNDLIKNLDSSAPSRIYIVSPATRVNFISDDYEFENTRVFFLKVPYKMIEELHEVPFEALNQPQSKTNINEIEEMKGFQFIYAPEVECWLEEKEDSIDLVLNKFSSYSITGGEVDDFSTVSSIFVNYDYNGEYFIMDDVKFLDEIESKAKKNSDTSIRETDHSKQIIWSFDKNLLGEKSIFIFSDTAGNEVTIELSREDL